MTLTATPTWLLGPEIPPASRIGTVLNGTYRLDALLGQGRTGITYNAWHLRQKMPFAVTLLHRDLQPTHDQVSKLRQDLRTLGGLGLGPYRQGIPTIELSFAPDGAPFLAMELLVGETLRERLKRGPLPALAAGFVGAGLARVLERAHQEGVVHGDLRPERIFLVTPQTIGVTAGLPQPALLGTALHHLRKRQVGLDEDVPLERLAYLAPEQASGEIAQPDAAGDIFALGAVLYECLTGQGAFTSTELEGVLEKLAQPPPPLELPRQVGAPPGLAAALDQVLRQACARDPQERFQSMQVFRAVLGQIYAGVGLALPDVGDEGPPSVPNSKAARRSTVAVKRVVPVRPASAPPEGKADAKTAQEAAGPAASGPQPGEPAPAATADGPASEPGTRPAAQAPSPSGQTPKQRGGPEGSQPGRQQRPVKSTVKARDLSRLMADIAAGRIQAAQALAIAAGEIEEEAVAAVQPEPELSEAERIAAAGRAAVLARAEAARQVREREAAGRQAQAAAEQQQVRQRDLESARAAVFARMRVELNESDERRRLDWEERRRQDKERAENARRALERLEQERAEAAHRVAQEAERARQEAELAEAARREMEKAEAARQEAERAEAQRREAARVEQERAVAARREVERIASEQASARLREMAQAESARQEAERAQAAGVEAAERERERRAAAQAAEAAAWAALQIKQAGEAAAADEAKEEAEHVRAEAAAEQALAAEVSAEAGAAAAQGGAAEGTAQVQAAAEGAGAISADEAGLPRPLAPSVEGGRIEGGLHQGGGLDAASDHRSAGAQAGDGPAPGSSASVVMEARVTERGGRPTAGGGSRAAQERAAALLRAEAEVRQAREREARLTTVASQAEAEAQQARERAQAAAQSAAEAAHEGRQRAQQAEHAEQVAAEAQASQAREVALAAQAEMATLAARAMEEERTREVAAAEEAERQARESQNREAARVRRLTEAMTVVKQTIQLTLSDVEDEMEAMAEQGALAAQQERSPGPAAAAPAEPSAAPTALWAPVNGDDPWTGPAGGAPPGPAGMSGPMAVSQPPPIMTAEEAVRLASGIYVDRNALGPPSGLYQAQSMPVLMPNLVPAPQQQPRGQVPPQMRPQLQHPPHAASPQPSHLMPMVTGQIPRASLTRQPPSWQIWALGALVVILATIVCVLALLVVLK